MNNLTYLGNYVAKYCNDKQDTKSLTCLLHMRSCIAYAWTVKAYTGNADNRKTESSMLVQWFTDENTWINKAIRQVSDQAIQPVTCSINGIYYSVPWIWDEIKTTISDVKTNDIDDIKADDISMYYGQLFTILSRDDLWPTNDREMNAIKTLLKVCHLHQYKPVLIMRAIETLRHYTQCYDLRLPQWRSELNKATEHFLNGWYSHLSPLSPHKDRSCCNP
jgi:hypothetical protein